jgi:hypothetical protein
MGWARYCFYLAVSVVETQFQTPLSADLLSNISGTEFQQEHRKQLFYRFPNPCCYANS